MRAEASMEFPKAQLPLKPCIYLKEPLLLELWIILCYDYSLQYEIGFCRGYVAFPSPNLTNSIDQFKNYSLALQTWMTSNCCFTTTTY